MFSSMKLKVLMLCISVTSIVSYNYSLGRRTGFAVVIAGITTETGVNHFHLVKVVFS